MELVKELGDVCLKIIKFALGGLCQDINLLELESIRTEDFRTHQLTEIPVMLVSLLMFMMTGVLVGSLLHWISRLKKKLRVYSSLESTNNFQAVQNSPEIFKTYSSAFIEKLYTISSTSFSKLVRSKPITQASTTNKSTIFHTSDFLEPFTFDLDERKSSSLNTDEGKLLLNFPLFSVFSDEVITTLCKSLSSVTVQTGGYLFNAADYDDTMYIVKYGKVNLYSQAPDGTRKVLKIAKSGEFIGSLVSLLESFIFTKRTFTTLSAQATEDTTILKLRFTSIREIFSEEPNSSFKFVRMLITRIIRIHYTAFPQNLGLSIFKQRNSDILLEITSEKSNSYLRKQASKSFVMYLGLEDNASFQDQVVLKTFFAGETLVREKNAIPTDIGLILVMSGLLQTTLRSIHDKESLLFDVKTGEFIGEMGLVSSEASFVTLKAKFETLVAILPHDIFANIIMEVPKSRINVIKQFVGRLPQFAREVDFGVDWMCMKKGQLLYCQNDVDYKTYLILRGHLRSVITNCNGLQTLRADFENGHCIGIEETFLRKSRTSTVFAMRNTELIQITEHIMDLMKGMYPEVLEGIILKLEDHINTFSLKNIGGRKWQQNKPRFKTVCLLSVTSDVPLSIFTFAMKENLKQFGPTVVLTSDTSKNIQTTNIFNEEPECIVDNWISNIEDTHRFILLECDKTWSPWTVKCAQRADIILSVGLGKSNAPVHELEKKMAKIFQHVHKELVLLHKPNSTPKDTAFWLHDRPWCVTHHHVLCPESMFCLESVEILNIFPNIDVFIEENLQSLQNTHSDVSRLARYLNGTQVSVVLSGGGAKGAAHVGVIKSLMQCNIPVDRIGGVSIGSLVAGIFAKERNIEIVDKSTHSFFEIMDSTWRFVIDIAFPYTSYFSGRPLNHKLKSIFGDTQIEDLWLPYFALSTDLTNLTPRVHQKGNLWRYTRASMSIAGIFPPICDEMDGHLLVDGMYSDVLGVQSMKASQVGTIYAVDISACLEATYSKYGDTLSGSTILFAKCKQWLGGVKVNFPGFYEQHDRLSQLSCVPHLHNARIEEGINYIRPIVDNFSTLDFSQYEKIKDCGEEAVLHFLQHTDSASL